MGRTSQASGPRERVVSVRLNPAEASDLDQKRSRRGLDASNYFRTLMKEDRDDQP